MVFKNLFRLLFFFSFFIACNQGFSQEIIDAAPHDTVKPNGYNVFHYDNGKVSSEGSMQNGKPEGYWKNYYEDGKIKSEGFRHYSLLDSTWKFYSPKGYIALILNYKDGQRHGVQMAYYDSAKLKSKEVYVYDKKSGLSEYFYENGKPFKEVTFAEGVEQGISKEFDEEGLVIFITTYKDGYVIKSQEINRKDTKGFRQGPWKYFYDRSQQVKWEGVFKNNKKNGTFKEYSLDGKVTKTEEYLDGELVDFTTIERGKKVKMEIHREYYPNAQDHIVGSYKNGVPEGVFREYSMEGNVIDTKVYKDGRVTGQGIMDDSGLQQGHWKFFYRTGKIKSEGDYLDGKKTGPWKFYHENGNMMQTCTFVDDKTEGICRWYYENGKILREEFYKKGKENGDIKEFSDSTGKVITSGSYLDGKKDGNWTYEIGDIKATGPYLDGKEEGAWKESYKDGSPSFEGSYKDGQENGVHKYYYSNGQIKEERKYRLGMRDGVWKIYEREGNLIVTITYRDDKEVKIDGLKVIPENIKRGRALKR